MTARRPPRLARLLASLLLRADARDVVLGDLDEELARSVGAGADEQRARRHYWRQAIASIVACGRWRRSDSRSAAPPSEAPLVRRLLTGTALDLRHARRSLGGAPVLSIVAIASLAIGIGANATVVRLIQRILIEPLPVDRPHELALVYWAGPGKNGVRRLEFNSDERQDPATGRFLSSNFTYRMAAAMQAAAPPGVQMFAFNVIGPATVSIDGRPPVPAGGLLVGPEYFQTMRIALAAGRAFTAADHEEGAPPVVVLSHAFWTRAFGADPSAVGRTLRVNGAVCEIVGVTARGYDGLSRGADVPAADVTLPLAAQAFVMPRWNDSPAAGASLFTSDVFWVRLLARVSAPSPGLQSRLRQVLGREYSRLPGGARVDPAQLALRLLPGSRGIGRVDDDAETTLRVLAAVSVIVLLMACLNVSALLLARGAARERELSVRRALGAGRLRIARVVLAESILLASAGVAGSVLLAVWAGPIVSAMLAAGFDAPHVDVGVDWTLLAIAIAVAGVAALLAGAVPAVRLSAQAGSSIGERRDGGGVRLAAGRTLIALQIAVSVPLLVGAGLLLRTLHNFSVVPIGFDPEGLSAFRVDTRLAGSTAERDPVPLFDRVLADIRALPGVESATLAEQAPSIGRLPSNTDVRLDGEPIRMSMNAVGPDFFTTMRIPIVAGRGIEARDDAGAPPVVVIDAAAAAAYFPAQSPIGRRLTVGRREVTIVGVAASVRTRDRRTAPAPMFYDAYGQRSFDVFPALAKILPSPAPTRMDVIVRTAMPDARLAELVAEALARAAPALPVRDVRSYAQQMGDTVVRERLVGVLLTALGCAAVLLAGIGLHGVTAYAVARRTSEIGIRLALGAQRTAVVWLILRQVLLVVAAGMLVGVPMAIAAGPLLVSLLFGVAPRDAVTIGSASVALVAVALLAGWLPARQAACLPVVAATRHD